MGHEIIHGFDTLGMKYDKYGNIAKFWSEKSERAFQEKSRCFVEQYDNMTIEGTKGTVSGSKTINENIADNSGLKIAYTAFKKYELTKSERPKLVGFENFTSSQLFFIAFGSVSRNIRDILWFYLTVNIFFQMWCYTITSEQAEYSLKIDVHSPASVRVNVAVQNSNHFAEAFNCPQGSPMNPGHKCEMW
ncbi:neprilysin-21-like [Coccinella septempunctata]|uniref:neprilysin-21-like n=1 Tax=Coccinella septempunctata TaxID=41139 RepID=UPI001D06BDCC|nr:neprilysin-21-like [Coccinella septempunctata]